MLLNLTNLIYLFFRLSPFVIVSSFAISSIIYSDVKGFVYLVGAIFAAFVSIIVGNVIPDDANIVPNPQCNLISLGNMQETLSKIPLSITILSYTFGYLLTVIIKVDIAKYNIPTLVIFPLLIVCDIWWNSTNNCNGIPNIIAGLILGGLIGAAWSAIILSFGVPEMQYFSIGNDSTVCKRPTKNLFKCTFGANTAKQANIAEMNEVGDVVNAINNNGDVKTPLTRLATTVNGQTGSSITVS